MFKRANAYNTRHVVISSSLKGWEAMRIFLTIVALLLIFMGGVWFLQGINVIPGSFMTGQSQWVVYGGITFIVGLGLLVFANRRRIDQKS